MPENHHRLLGASPSPARSLTLAPGRSAPFPPGIPHKGMRLRRIIGALLSGAPYSFTIQSKPHPSLQAEIPIALRREHAAWAGDDLGPGRRSFPADRYEQHVDARTKGKAPPQRVDEEPQIAGVTDDAIDTACHQRMSGLDRHQPAEPAAEHEDRPEPQRATGREESDAKPADGVAIEGPELLSVRPGRQKGVEQPDHPEDREDPAVAPILAHSWTDISAAKSATPDSAKNAIAIAISAGWEKKAASPPQPRTARPR